MLDLKALLTKILKSLITTTTTLSSSNWTAGTATFSSGTIFQYGNVIVCNLALKATSAMNAGSEYTLGTLKGIDLTGIGRSAGIQVYGTVTCQTTGIVRSAMTKAIAANANLYLRFIWVS